ncbi:hypothetical protein CC80DRAFT_315893 [Byssothecium circinans]|uniref:Uncharacterized protein n=1 Tax=Byssothecium circinans TaxID=147558 RepID=A0A6A5THL9_9PLEO|nr:hypothetical protein CC80DRAFT_315893 [Byssothecium circinans]
MMTKCAWVEGWQGRSGVCTWLKLPRRLRHRVDFFVSCDCHYNKVQRWNTAIDRRNVGTVRCMFGVVSGELWRLQVLYQACNTRHDRFSTFELNQVFCADVLFFIFTGLLPCYSGFTLLSMSVEQRSYVHLLLCLFLVFSSPIASRR